MLWTFNSSSLSRVIAIWKNKMMFFGKVKIIIQWCYVKENVNELRVSLMKSLIKKTQFSNYALLTKGKYVLAIAQTITRTTLLTCLRHSFFLFLSCVKSLRSRFLSRFPPAWNTFFLIVFAYGSNRLQFSTFSWEYAIKKLLWMCFFYTKKWQYITDNF